MGELNGRTALVIGGGAGMGLASAQMLASHGATVLIADRDGDAAERAASSIRSSDGDAVSYQVDVSSQPKLKALFEFASSYYRTLNVLFSNVGVRGPEGFEATEEEFDEVFNVNVKQHYFATQFAVPLMRPCAPCASIIYMGSAAGIRYVGGSPLYAVSKASLHMMSRAFARHLGPEGIRVNTLCPGPIDTAFSRQGIEATRRQQIVERWQEEIPLRRIAKSQDVANVVRFLASDQSQYLTGLLIPVDGGLSA